MNKDTRHPLDIPRPSDQNPVGPLFGRQFHTAGGAIGISDGDTARVLCFMNGSGAYEGKRNEKQMLKDAKELAHRYNVHPELLAACQAVRAGTQHELNSPARQEAMGKALGLVLDALKQAEAAH